MRVWCVPTKTPLSQTVHSNDGNSSHRTRTRAVGTSYWRIEADGGSDRQVSGAVLAIPAFGDGEIYARSANLADYEYRRLYLGFRAQQPVALNQTVWYPFMGAYSVMASDGRVQLYVNATSLGYYSVSGTDLKIRCRASGTKLKVRAWPSSGTEPGTWGLSVTDGTYSNGAIAFAGFIYNSTSNQGDQANWAQYVLVYPVGIDYGGTNAPTSGGLKTISGQVTMGGSPVQGATVIAVRDGYDFSNPGIPGVDFAKATTDANGNYTLSLDVDSGDRWFIQAKYLEGFVYYTGVVDAPEGATGVDIGLRPGRVTRARYKDVWYTTIYDKQGGIWVPRS